METPNRSHSSMIAWILSTEFEPGGSSLFIHRSWFPGMKYTRVNRCVKTVNVSSMISSRWERSPAMMRTSPCGCFGNFLHHAILFSRSVCTSDVSHTRG